MGFLTSSQQWVYYFFLCPANFQLFRWKLLKAGKYKKALYLIYFITYLILHIRNIAYNIFCTFVNLLYMLDIWKESLYTKKITAFPHNLTIAIHVPSNFLHLISWNHMILIQLKHCANVCRIITINASLHQSENKTSKSSKNGRAFGKNEIA